MTDAERLAERLEELCVDWTGEQIVDESTPRVETSCGMLRQAAQLIRHQAARIAELEGALRNVINAADSFCDCDGDFVAGQVKIRARKALGKGSE